MAFRNLRTARVARRADLDFALGLAPRAARCVAGGRIDTPRDAAPLVERDAEAFGRVRSWFGLCPRDVCRARPMARLATDRHLRPRGREAVVRRVVAFAHIGRMAIGAHEVPVLRALRPVQLVAEVDLLVRVQVKPALAALGCLARIPGDRQGLNLPAGQFDQVLLQGLEAVGVLDLELRKLAVGAVGAHEVLAVAPGESGGDSGVAELRVVEVAADRFGVCVLHRPRMLRSLPRRVLGAMTVGAGLAADEFRDDRGRYLRAS